MNFTVQKRIIKCDGTKVIGDNADYTATFDFDAEWDGKTKTARFENLKGLYVDVMLTNDSCTIPVSVLKRGIIRVGVYCDVYTTTYCEIAVTESIKERSGAVLPPTPDVYQQIIEKLDGKVDNTGAGVSGALFNLDFNSHEVDDETQIVVRNDETKWVRRKLNVVADYIKTKMSSNFVSVEPQTLTKQQRIQVRENIKCATGGNRTLAQTVEEGFVDLRDYTSVENAFTTPSDGYLQIRKAGTSGTAYLHVDNYTLCSSTNGQTSTIFCAQGMKVWVDNQPSGASFIPWIVKED
ncbi:MAG: hypothetical protein HUJ98_00950 [Bacteroidaceae bacterium]|nr:hypothetical protein [Holdemanella sp.]MCF0185040.1 hypothetical protein [Bacteroidaceae bacterium]